MPEKAQRRRFTAAYKLRVLEEAARCRAPGELGHCSGAKDCVDPEGFGKVGLFVRTVKGAWKYISKSQANRLLDKAGTRILVEGPGSSKKARNLAKRKFGAKKVRHDGRKPGERPHWQHKNGGRGKLMYSLNVGATLGVCTFGDNLLGNSIDFFNPLSDLNDLAELGAELFGGPDDGSDDDWEEE